VVVGRAPTVGDTSGDEGECSCDEAACGGEISEADTSVPAAVEVSISRRSWSSDTSVKVATVGNSEDGTGCGIANADDDDDAGDGIAAM